jgi:hypothetical protein
MVQGLCPSACKRNFVRVSRGRWYWLVVSSCRHFYSFVWWYFTPLLITTLTAACSRPCVTDGRLHHRSPVLYNVTWQDTSTTLQFITIMSHSKLHQRPPFHYNDTWQATSTTPQFITIMSHGGLHQQPPFHYNVTWQDTSTTLQFITIMSHSKLHQRPPFHYNVT